MGTYNVPRIVKGEGRILFIFTTKSLIYSAVGVGVGLIFYLIFKLMSLTVVGIAMVVYMCNTCAVSLSLEGRNLWVVESLPISKRTLYKGKMLFNICMVLPVSLICSVIFIISLRVNVVKALLYIVFAVASVTFSTVFGMFINICFPNYQWENEVVVVKQGMSSMIGIFSSIIIYLAMAAGTFYLSGNLGGELSILMFSGILAVLAAVLYGRCK